MRLAAPSPRVAGHEQGGLAELDHVGAEFLGQNQKGCRVDAEGVLEGRRIDLGIVREDGRGGIQHHDLGRAHLRLDPAERLAEGIKIGDIDRVGDGIGNLIGQLLQPACLPGDHGDPVAALREAPHQRLAGPAADADDNGNRFRIAHCAPPQTRRTEPLVKLDASLAK